MRRRSVLVGSIGIAAGLAGCTGVLGGSDDDSDGSSNESAIVEPIRQYVELAGDGKPEAARANLHPEGPWAQSDTDIVELLDHNNATVEAADVVDRSGDRATVEYTIRDFPGSESGYTYSQTVQIRKHQGEWLVYGVPEDESDTEPRPPQAQFEVEERTGDGLTTAVAFEHQGGDTIDVATLRATVGDETVGTETDGRMSTGNAAVVPFEGEGDPLDRGTEITLVWDHPEGGGPQPIATHELSEPTAGATAERLRIE